MMGEFHRYEPMNPENGLKRCSWCGDDLQPEETVERIDGVRGSPAQLAPAGCRGAHGIRLYHPRCRRKRELIKRRAENEYITEYTEGSV